jgi:hypothetical protein
MSSDQGDTKEKINTVYIKIRDWIDETYSHLDRLTTQTISCTMQVVYYIPYHKTVLMR